MRRSLQISYILIFGAWHCLCYFILVASEMQAVRLRVQGYWVYCERINRAASLLILPPGDGVR